MNYEFLIYIDFLNNKKSIVEYNCEFYIYDYQHNFYNRIDWQKNGLTEVLNIMDRDAKKIIYSDNDFFVGLINELIEIDKHEFCNVRMILDEYSNR